MIKKRKSVQPNQLNNIKCVVLGPGNVGKTCLLIRYTTNEFQENIFQLYLIIIANIMIDDIPVQLGLWDTAGGEDYHRLRPLSYPCTDIFIICMSVYDGTSRKMDKSGMWTDLAVDTMAFCQEVQALLPYVPRILVGTKTDLRDDKKSQDNCYTKQEMEIFADVFGCHSYIECSASTGDNVNETFDYVTRIVINDVKTSKKGCTCVIL